MMFSTRQDAGRQLGQKLVVYKGEAPIVLAIPRGGVAVGAEIAKVLDAKFDVLVARKIGAPGQSEFGIGAIAENGVVILDKKSIVELGISKAELARVVNFEKQELERRVKLYRRGRSMINVRGRLVILVDDGLATGVSAKAAIEAARKFEPAKIIAAFPVCPKESAKEIIPLVDEFICLETPDDFFAVGEFYKNFEQVSDDEVVRLLAG